MFNRLLVGNNYRRIGIRLVDYAGGFNDTSSFVVIFVSSHREREKRESRDRRDSRGDEREGQGRKWNRNESEETEEIKYSPSTLTRYKDSRPCSVVSQYQLDAVSDTLFGLSLVSCSSIFFYSINN